MTRKERVFAVEGYGSDGVFDGVGIHLDTAIGQEDLQTIPVLMDVCEFLAKAGFGGDTGALKGQPLAKVGDQRGRLFLAGSEALFGCSASDTGFDLIYLRDAAQALGGDLGAKDALTVTGFFEISRPSLPEC